MRSLVARTLCLLALVPACGKRANEGLPPATEWRSSDVGAGGASAAGGGGGGGHGGASGNNFGDPHAGVAGAPPIGGTGGGGGDLDNPHAGVPGAPPIGGNNPHVAGGMPSGGVDVTQLGLSSPDPDRPIDPSRRVRGVLKLGPAAKGKLAANGAIFLIVKQAGPDGKPVGAPLAVEKVTWTKDPLAFELTEQNAMVAGTELKGDVVVSARYDQDSDAISKQPGDVTGQTRVKVPADNVVVTLDTVLP